MRQQTGNPMQTQEVLLLRGDGRHVQGGGRRPSQEREEITVWRHRRRPGLSPKGIKVPLLEKGDFRGLLKSFCPLFQRRLYT